MTTLALGERWTFAGVDLSSYAIITPLVVGADELPAVRGDDFVRSGVQGRLYASKLLDSRRVALSLIVTALDASGTYGGPSRARTNLDALLAVLAPRGQSALTRLMPDGTTRTAQAECIAVNNISDPAAHEVFRLTAQFQMTDPLWYGPTTTGGAGAGTVNVTASPTDFTFVLGGNAKSTRLTISFVGAITHPRITNNSTGAMVDINQAVGGSKLLLIDAQAFTALNDGVDAIANLTHGPTVTLFDLIPGNNLLRVTASSPGGTVQVSALPAWY